MLLLPITLELTLVYCRYGRMQEFYTLILPSLGDADGDSAGCQSTRVRVLHPMTSTFVSNAHRNPRFYMYDPIVLTDLRKFMFDPKCACSQNWAEKCLTEMAKMGNLGSESSQHSPPSWSAELLSMLLHTAAHHRLSRQHLLLLLGNLLLPMHPCHLSIPNIACW